MRSGELAKKTGVSTDTLRHYERIGVLQRPSRSVSGYRQYPQEAERRVLLVRCGLAIGLKLSDLAKILATRDRGGAPCGQVRALAASRLKEVERELAELATFRDRLKSVLHDWDLRLEATPAGRPALLLETLTEAPSGKEERNATHNSRSRSRFR